MPTTRSVHQPIDNLGSLQVSITLADDAVEPKQLDVIADCIKLHLSSFMEQQAIGICGIHPRNPGATDVTLTSKQVQVLTNRSISIDVRLTLDFKLDAVATHFILTSYYGELLGHINNHLDDPTMNGMKDTLSELAMKPALQLAAHLLNNRPQDILHREVPDCWMVHQLIETIYVPVANSLTERLERLTEVKDGSLVIDFGSLLGRDTSQSTPNQGNTAPGYGGYL